VSPLFVVFKIASTTTKRNAMAMAGPKADTDILIVGQDAAFVTDRKANTEIIVEGNQVTRAGVYGGAFRGRMTDDERKAAAAKYRASVKTKQMEFERMSREQKDSEYADVDAERARALSAAQPSTAVAASSAKDAEDEIVGAKRPLVP